MNLRAIEKGLLPFETSPNDLSRSRWFKDVRPIVYEACQIDKLSAGDRDFDKAREKLERFGRDHEVMIKTWAAEFDPINSVEDHIIDLTDKDSRTRQNLISIDKSLSNQ